MFYDFSKRLAVDNWSGPYAVPDAGNVYFSFETEQYFNFKPEFLSVQLFKEKFRIKKLLETVHFSAIGFKRPLKLRKIRCNFCSLLAYFYSQKRIINSFFSLNNIVGKL